MKVGSFLAGVVWLLSSGLRAADTGRLILDAVLYNADEKRITAALDNPPYEASVGFNGKVLDMFDSPLLAVDWQDIDPRVFPRFSAGRKWVNKKAEELDRRCSEAKAAGLKVYAQCDMVLLPKSLVEKNRLRNSLGDASNPTIQNFIRLNIRQALKRFPIIDGYIIRFGETYTQGSPFHDGMLDEPKNINKTIVPLIELLHDEICRKGGRKLIIRTWNSFDLPETYRRVDEVIVADGQVIFSVKHCEGDFHRGNNFSRIIGMGRHQQLIEVQCAREYEGKGAYPNYIANGVIDGFEEHIRAMPSAAIRSIGAFANQSKLFAGIWTWSRGGGWDGPYINNELWPQLNAWVIAQWAKHPEESEESIFNRFALEQLRLKPSDAERFREFCMMSADAVIRGRLSLEAQINPWWTRDDTINTPTLPKGLVQIQMVLREKEEAVELWRHMTILATQIEWPDKKVGAFITQSANYGLSLYLIYQAVFELKACEVTGNKLAIKKWLRQYDESWESLEKLCAATNAPATSYRREGSRAYSTGEAVDLFVERMRKLAVTSSLSR